MHDAMQLIARERVRQQSKGYTAEHDDWHDDGSLVLFAQQIVERYVDMECGVPESGVPAWAIAAADHAVEKHDDPTKLLVIVGAVIAAEVERRIRADRRFEVEHLAALMEPAVWQKFTEVEKLNLIRHMERVGMVRLPAVCGDPNGERASGEAVCSECGHPYGVHPPDWRLIGYGNVPFLTVLCDGRRVKL